MDSIAFIDLKSLKMERFGRKRVGAFVVGLKGN